MTDDDMIALLRPYVQRIADAVLARAAGADPYAPEPATFAAFAPHFSAADAPRFADYFADTDGCYPTHMHAMFGCNPREFADHSGLVRKQITDKNNHKVWHWVRRDSPAPTPQSRTPHDAPAATNPAAPPKLIPDPADKPGVAGRTREAVVAKLSQTKGGRAALALGGGAWKIGRAIEHRLMFTIIKIGQVVEKAIQERGFPPDRAENLKHALKAADFLGGYALAAGAAAGGLPLPAVKAAAFLPSASVAYLMYSTAVNPKATWRAAKRVLADTFTKEDSVATHAAEAPDEFEADGLLLADALRDAADPDMFVAVFCAALAETKGDVKASIELARHAAAADDLGADDEDDDDEPTVMSEAEYEAFGAALVKKKITVQPKKGKAYQKTVLVAPEEAKTAKPAAKKAEPAPAAKTKPAPKAAPAPAAKTEAPKPKGDKFTEAELDAYAKWRAARAAEASAKSPAKKLTKEDRAKAAQREKFAKLAAVNYVKSSGLDVGEPGSQLPAGVRDKALALDMVGSFPPAHVPLGAITISDAKKSKDKVVMQWDQETQSNRISRQCRYVAGVAERNAAEKFERVARLEPHVKKAKAALVKTMTSEKAEGKDQDAAAIALIIMETGLRPTDGKESVKHGHYGVASLQARHVKVVGDEVKLDFIGKEGVRNRTTIRDPETVAFLKLTLEDRAPREPIWIASSDHAGAALKKAVVAAGGNDEVMLKDLRTRVGTIAGRKAVEDFAGPPPPLTGDKEQDVKIIAKAILTMSGEVAKILNNGATMARDNYIAPEVFQAWQRKLSSAAKPDK